MFPFRRLPRLAWYSAGIRPRLHTGRFVSYPTYPAYNILALTTQKTPFLIFLFLLLPWEHVCLRSRYSVTVFVYFISWSLPSNGYTFHIIMLDFTLKASAFFPHSAAYHSYVVRQVSWNTEVLGWPVFVFLFWTLEREENVSITHRLLDGT
jgi:hypothetical protein